MPRSKHAEEESSSDSQQRSRLWRVVMWVGVAALLAWVAIAAVLLLRNEEAPPPLRLLEMTADNSGCRPSSISVQPGEKIRFRISNLTDERMEMIVTDSDGIDLRTSAGYAPPPPEADELGADLSPGVVPEEGRPTEVRLASASFLPFEVETAHDGHEDETGPDANSDFRYRLVVSPNGVRPMVVTFPEIGEDVGRLTRFSCMPLSADAPSDALRLVGEISGSGGR